MPLFQVQHSKAGPGAATTNLQAQGAIKALETADLQNQLREQQIERGAFELENLQEMFELEVREAESLIAGREEDRLASAARREALGKQRAVTEQATTRALERFRRLTTPTEAEDGTTQPPALQGVPAQAIDRALASGDPGDREWAVRQMDKVENDAEDALDAQLLTEYAMARYQEVIEAAFPNGQIEMDALFDSESYDSPYYNDPQAARAAKDKLREYRRTLEDPDVPGRFKRAAIGGIKMMIDGDIRAAMMLEEEMLQIEQTLMATQGLPGDWAYGQAPAPEAAPGAAAPADAEQGAPAEALDMPETPEETTALLEETFNLQSAMADEGAMRAAQWWTGGVDKRVKRAVNRAKRHNIGRLQLWRYMPEGITGTQPEVERAVTEVSLLLGIPADSIEVSRARDGAVELLWPTTPRTGGPIQQPE